MLEFSAMVPAKLQKLFSEIDGCASCALEKNSLRHVFGGGKFFRPKFFFLFINPTHKNLSSNPGYAGERRFPFMGVRHLYRGLAEAGFVDMDIIDDMYRRGWEVADEHRIEKSLRERGVYITNFVKCVRPNPKNPTVRVMREHLPLLARELAVVRPEFIVTFGLPPLRALTGRDFRMRDVLAALGRGEYAPVPVTLPDGESYNVLPCYYPLGHGNPPKAHAILSHIQRRF